MKRGFARFIRNKPANITFPVPYSDKINQFALSLQPDEDFIGKNQELEVYLRDSNLQGFEINPKFALQD